MTDNKMKLKRIEDEGGDEADVVAGISLEVDSCWVEGTGYFVFRPGPEQGQEDPLVVVVVVVVGWQSHEDTITIPFGGSHSVLQLMPVVTRSMTFKAGKSCTIAVKLMLVI